jgi:hypothetical protein
MEVQVVSPRILSECSLERTAIAADKLIAAIQDHLRCVWSLQRQPLRVGVLPVRKHRRGVWIFPAEIVPIRDMFADTHDQLLVGCLRKVDLTKKRVCRRATGATFRGKQFDNGNRAVGGDVAPWDLRPLRRRRKGKSYERKGQDGTELHYGDLHRSSIVRRQRDWWGYKAHS